MQNDLLKIIVFEKYLEKHGHATGVPPLTLPRLASLDGLPDARQVPRLLEMLVDVRVFS